MIVLIHLERGAGPHGDSGAADTLPLEQAKSLKWYCDWLRDGVRSVNVLVPDDRELELQSAVFMDSDISLTSYGPDGIVTFPPWRRRESVWLVNGGRLPMVNWNEATAAGRRQQSEVLVFGLSARAAVTHYPESVLVSNTGEVVRFLRHYHDSPSFAELSSGQAAFLSTQGERAASVISHVLLHGWGLESIGALTQRCSVKWSRASCVLPLSETASLVTGPVARAAREPDDPRGRHAFDSDVGSDASGRSDGFREDSPWDSDRSTWTVGAVSSDSMRWDHALMEPVGSSVDWSGAEQEDADELPDDVGYAILKRSFDVAASAIALICTAPLLLVVAVMVKLTSPGPIFFAHKRQGLGGKEFHCLKFRSMTTDADALQAQLRGDNEVDGPQFKIAADPRLTKLGPWLRRHNIDELPQLFNVLSGQMSLVGPRPSPDGENQMCPAWRRTRLSVRPGVTGLWQVLRRRDCGDSDFQEWIYYDVEYARHRSLWLDWQILLHTPIAMFAPRFLGGFMTRLERRGICVHSDRGKGAVPVSNHT